MKAGPSMVKFGHIYGIPTDEVVEWVHGYVNGPWVPPLDEVIEPTKEERLAYIKSYIQYRIDDSATMRVKLGKVNIGEPVVVHSCPF